MLRVCGPFMAASCRRSQDPGAKLQPTHSEAGAGPVAPVIAGISEGLQRCPKRIGTDREPVGNLGHPRLSLRLTSICMRIPEYVYVHACIGLWFHL